VPIRRARQDEQGDGGGADDDMDTSAESLHRELAHRRAREDFQTTHGTSPTNVPATNARVDTPETPAP